MFPKITLLNFFYCYIYSPTYQTFVSNPLFWYSGPDPVVFEEEPEAVAGEPLRVVEWQADDVV